MEPPSYAEVKKKSEDEHDSILNISTDTLEPPKLMLVFFCVSQFQGTKKSSVFFNNLLSFIASTPPVLREDWYVFSGTARTIKRHNLCRKLCRNLDQIQQDSRNKTWVISN